MDPRANARHRAAAITLCCYTHTLPVSSSARDQLDRYLAEGVLVQEDFFS